MSSYISSNSNRFYAALEGSYGIAAPVTGVNRFPAVRLAAQQSVETGRRFDKTGGRTFRGAAPGARRHTAFQVRTYLTSWGGSGQPGYGPLFEAAMGAQPTLNAGLVVAAMPSSTELQTTAPHGLEVGSGIACGNEIRFVSAVVDPQSVTMNAPFAVAPQGGATLSPALTYSLASNLPTVSIFDYWDPISAVSRLVVGGGVDTLEISVNGDYQELTFAGPAANLLDSSSFIAGSGGLSTFPAEPGLGNFDYSIVPGHLGEVWLGGTNQFFTLSGASIEIKNNLALRDSEFGSSYPRALAAGNREVLSKFSLFAQDDAQSVELYVAAKMRTPVPAMLQLGQQQGQLLGIYMPQVVPEIPHFDDSEPRLQWQFQNNLAQGSCNDEIYIAFA